MLPFLLDPPLSINFTQLQFEQKIIYDTFRNLVAKELVDHPGNTNKPNKVRPKQKIGKNSVQVLAEQHDKMAFI